MATVIVGGALANKPLSGGEAWVRLNWVLGLRRLGHDVCFAEQIELENCRDANGEPTDFRSSINRSYFAAVTEEFGLADSAALVCNGTRETSGLGLEGLLERAAGAELLVNISGHLTLEELVRPPRLRVYVDLDPGFTQAWHAAGVPGLSLKGYDHFLTVGTNVGRAECPIPTGGIDWRPVAPPVVLEEWPPAPPAPAPERFTTVTTWRSPYGPVEIGQELHSLKHHEFRKVLDLPRRAVAGEFEVALDIHPADTGDLEALRTHGWRIADPRLVAAGPRAYREYVQGSGAEFSVAQGVYVGTRSGWFSDRTACYLASGRPTLVQDTGFDRSYPAGEGLVPFTGVDGAVEGAQRIIADYESHSAAARAVAERHFDSELVLGRVLDELGVSG